MEPGATHRSERGQLVNDFDLCGRCALSPASGAGLGGAWPRGLLGNGATVVLSGRTRATLDETAAAIGDKAIVVTADVARGAVALGAVLRVEGRG